MLFVSTSATAITPKYQMFFSVLFSEHASDGGGEHSSILRGNVNEEKPPPKFWQEVYVSYLGIIHGFDDVLVSPRGLSPSEASSLVRFLKKNACPHVRYMENARWGD